MVCNHSANMVKFLSVFLMLYLHQGYVTAAVTSEVADIVVSKENANSFLQGKSRSRRDLSQELAEECCAEDCDYEEIDEYKSWYDWSSINEALCKLSNLDGKSCTCQTKSGINYECGGTQHHHYSCSAKPCTCDGSEKDPKWWEVVDIKYDISKGSLKEYAIAGNYKTVDNLFNETLITPVFNISISVSDQETFSFTTGTSLKNGTKFTAGVPTVVCANISSMLTMPTEHTFGETVVKPEVKKAEIPCLVPPGKYVVCEERVDVIEMEIPYTMAIKHQHYKCNCTSSGIFRNIHYTKLHMKSIVYTSKPDWIK